jgi:hypothetical protein
MDFKTDESFLHTVKNAENYGWDKLIYGGSINLCRNKQNKEIKKNVCTEKKYISEKFTDGTIKPLSDNIKIKMIKYNKELYSEIDINKPTLSMSLFIDYRILFLNKLDAFIIKYFSNVLKIIIVFHYYFPSGNYRILLDKFTIDYLKKICDSYMIISKCVDEIQFFSPFDDNADEIQKIINEFFTEQKNYDEYKFKNAAERFIFYLELANQYRINPEDKKVFKSTKIGELFTFELPSQFTYEINGNMGHLTNGFIGQYTRFISLAQKPYNSNGKLIEIPKHFLFRDAHSTCINKLDSEWITEFNKIDKEVYMIPNTLGYIMDWHDKMYNPIDDKWQQKSTLVGIIQIINSKINVNELLYIQTIGKLFLVNTTTNKPAILDQRDFSYGVDEYIFTSIIEYVRNRIIWFNVKGFWEYKIDLIQDHYKMVTNISIVLLLIWLEKQKKIIKTEQLTFLKIVNLIEQIREEQDSTKFDNVIGTLLSIVPNKYHILNTSYDNQFAKDTLSKSFGTLADITKTWVEVAPFITDELNTDMLRELNINCQLVIAANSCLESWQTSYLKSDSNIFNCTPSDYYSGYYNQKTVPLMDIGILRQPSDLSYTVEALYKNNLSMKLNKSNYKLKVENHNLTDSIEKNDVFINNSDKILKKKIIDKIFEFNNGFFTSLIYGTGVSQISSKLQNVNNLDQMISVIIFKALNYCYYDIEPTWFQFEFDNNGSKVANEYAKKLCNRIGWADNAIFILTNIKDDTQFKMK